MIYERKISIHIDGMNWTHQVVQRFCAITDKEAWLCSQDFVDGQYRSANVASFLGEITRLA